MESIGHEIRKKRNSKRMSQSVLAKNLGLSKASVSDWERGVNTPTISNLIKLERLLEIGVLTKEFTSKESSK